MDMAYIKFERGPAVVQPVGKSSLGDVTTPWAPSVYRGDGSESRVTITANIPERVREDIQTLEELIRDKLRGHVSNVDARWHSSSKPSEKHSSSVRLKISITGAKTCPTLSSDGESIPMPSEWAGLAVIPIVHVKGVYVQKGMAGVGMEVVSLTVGEKKRNEVDVTFL